MKTKMICLEGVTPMTSWGYEVRRIPDIGIKDTNFFSYGDRFIIGFWRERFMFIKIIDKKIAEIYKNNFKMLWDSLK
jgi:hypothetical protein